MKIPATVFLIGLLAYIAVGQPVDFVLINANIRTLNEKNTRAEALAAAGGKIVAVGSTATIRKLAGPRTLVIDAQGRLVIPGFNDAHVHFSAIGNRFSYLDCRSKTKRDVLDAVSFHARMMPSGRWIRGGGLQLAAAPTLADIDVAAGDHPLLIYLADPRTALVNSAALKLAQVADEDGLINGQILARVHAHLPRSHTPDWAAIVETASNYAASLGVTSVQDVHSDDLGDVYFQLAEAGKLKTRVYECVGIADWPKLAERKPRTSPLVREGCVKGMAPSEDTGSAKLQRNVTAADRAGLQVMIHAIGEIENSTVIDVFEKTARQNGRRDRRFRIEHAHDLKPSDYRRLAQNDIIASMQPYLFGYSGDDHRKLLNANIRLALGSDASMTDFNPLMAIHAAVNAGPYSISVTEAVTAHTLGSAYAEFQEKEKGTLEVGKLADIVILSDDIFTHPSHIADARVVLTVVGGSVVFRADRGM